MPFDFPSAPLVGDTHTEFGVEYVYDGSVWNLAGGGAMTDYVLKAGDEMTGPLNIKVGAAGGLKVVASDPAHGHVHLSGGASDRTGMVEFFMGTQRKARFGWGTATEIEFAFENGSTGLKMIGGGLHWASDSAQTDPLNLSRGICLYGYGGTSQFGFSITSGTLNYVVQNAGNTHVFRVGAEEVMNVKSDGIRIPGGNLSVTGTTTSTGLLIANGGIDADVGNALFNTASFAGAVTINDNLNVNGQINLRDGDTLNFSNGCLIRKVSGANDFFFHTNAGQDFVWHVSGTGDVCIINASGISTTRAITVGGALNINGGAIVPESEHIQIGQSGDRSIGGGDGNGGIVHRAKGADSHKFFVGSDQEFTINSNGGSLLGSLEANGFIDRATGLDLIAEIRALNAKMKQLEAEIVQLRNRRR